MVVIIAENYLEPIKKSIDNKKVETFFSALAQPTVLEQ